jgi:hypothetical protein
MEYVMLAIMYILSTGSAYVIVKATTRGWYTVDNETHTRKFRFKAWFMEFKSFLFVLFACLIAIYILGPVAML